MEKRNGGLLLTTRVLRFPLDQLLHGSFVPADWVSIPCSISEVQFRGFERGCEARTPHHCIEPPVLPSEIAARIFEHALWMRKEGYRPSTIRGAVKNLKALSRHCNILNPESLKAYLATSTYGENNKDKIIGDMARFYKSLNIAWHRPLSRRVETLPFIPLEAEIDQLIGGLGPKLSAFTRIVKETGARPYEIYQLKWTDTDNETNTINITPEKGSMPSVFLKGT